MSQISDNSTLIFYCERDATPLEYFLASLIVTGISLLLLIGFMIFVAVESVRTKKHIEQLENEKLERTWITALDFIGGIGGVDSVFESYEHFFGKSYDQLEKLRQENIEHRRYSQPMVSQISEGDKAIFKEHINTRSRSNFEKVRLKRSSSEEEADFYLKVMNYPQIFHEHFPKDAKPRRQIG